MTVLISLCGILGAVVIAGMVVANYLVSQGVSRFEDDRLEPFEAFMREIER